MTRESFDRFISGILGLTVTDAGRSDDEPTSALSIVTCIRYWRFKPPIPARLQVVLSDGQVLDCRFKEELMLWKAIKGRGLLDRSWELVPAELRQQVRDA